MAVVMVVTSDEVSDGTFQVKRDGFQALLLCVP
jgi:hypothetical protein